MGQRARDIAFKAVSLVAVAATLVRSMMIHQHVTWHNFPGMHTLQHIWFCSLVMVAHARWQATITRTHGLPLSSLHT
jgi:hypothetical protein